VISTIHGADLSIRHAGSFGPYATAAWLPRARKVKVSGGPAMTDQQVTEPPYVSASERCP
jgi:hypothetical protein